MVRTPREHETTIRESLDQTTVPSRMVYFASCLCGWMSFDRDRRYLARFDAEEHLKATDPGTGWVEVDLEDTGQVAQEVTPS